MSGRGFDDDLFEDSQRMARGLSTQSAVSDLSNHDDVGDSAIGSQPESQNLLATGEQEQGSNQRSGTAVLDESFKEFFDRSLKRHLEPIKYEMKRLKQQIEVMDKKQTTTLTQNEQLQKQVKELKADLNKGADDLHLLMTGEIIQRLRAMCLRNLDMKAKDEEESELLNNFLNKAKEEGWLLKRTAKAEKDLISKYRDNRNYLKAQIRVRVHEDLTNQTHITASKLPKTLKFVREHLGIPDIGNDSLLIVYNYAYTTLKYKNKTIAEETMTGPEKIIKKKATQSNLRVIISIAIPNDEVATLVNFPLWAMNNIWLYVMDRVEADRKNKKEASQLKERIGRLLETGVKFESDGK